MIKKVLAIILFLVPAVVIAFISALAIGGIALTFVLLVLSAALSTIIPLIIAVLLCVVSIMVIFSFLN